MKILVAGDYCQRYRIDEEIRNHNYEKLFESIVPEINKADFRIVNYEFPVVISEDRANPINKCGPNLRGTKESIEAIKNAGFNICTLANNHILDQGEGCCLDTIQLLQEAGIKTVGAGKNVEAASEILYIKKDEETVAIINCCEHEFTIATETSAGANPLNPIQQYYKILEARKNADYVLVIVHGGHEHYQFPSPRMKELYRFFIEVGADAVVNHHQHCYSGYEIYNGKPIFYGLGNFLFDDPNKRNGIWNEGFMVTLTFGGNEVQYELIPYRQCNSLAKVELLSEGELHEFTSSINDINSVILNDKLLKLQHENWINATKEVYEIQFTPWKSRITKGLFHRGLLPSFIDENKKQALINFIECEAHHDKTVYILKNLSFK